ncbi:MAG: hemolysin family protein [Gemmatimonadota bacterium]
MTALLWVVGVSLAVSFLCSILEAVLLSLTRGHVALMRDRGERAGEYLHAMQLKIDQPIAAILTLNTIAHTVGAAMGGALALQVFGDAWMALFSAVLTLIILLFSEILPKTIGATLWKELAKPTAYVLRGLIIVMKPVLIPLSLFSRVIARDRVHTPTVSRAELEILAEIGRREGTLEESEWKVVSNLMNLEEVTVGEVMTPRTDMVAVEVGATVDEAKGIMLDAGHLRIPVYEGNLDRVVGILLARDLWQADREGMTHIRTVFRSPRFAPATKPVDELIPEMRVNRVKMVLVLDEFGGTAGLVTLEDLIEEIIGEIQDEHEEDEPEDFQQMEGGGLRIWGGASLRDLANRLDLELNEEDFDTVGGFVFGKLNRVARTGDEVPIRGGSLRVVKMLGRRVQYVRYIPEGEAKSNPVKEAMGAQ